MSNASEDRIMEALAHAAPNEEGMLALGLYNWRQGHLVEAYKWLILAADRHNPYARMHEKELARVMTTDQVNDARQLAWAYRSAPFSINSMTFGRASGLAVEVHA